jgi:RNA polymerase sigma factor (sigma-70 family)
MVVGMERDAQRADVDRMGVETTRATPGPIDSAAGEARLERIYAETIQRATGLGRMLTGNEAAAEDLAHEVFLIAARHTRRNPDYLQDPAWPWLRTALTRLAIRRRRQAIAELRRVARLFEPPREQSWPGFAAETVAVLMTLPPRMRACVALFYGEDLSTAEVAEAVGCSPRTVEVHLREARRRLRPILEAPGGLGHTAGGVRRD